MAKPIIADEPAVSAALARCKSGCSRTAKDKTRARRLLVRHHYLGDVRAVGEQLSMPSPTAAATGWGAGVSCAAARRLRARDRWIGWSEEQRRRLALVVNHCRFLPLPDKTFSQSGFTFVAADLDRLSADWQERYDHPVVLVETFVDPEQFCGTVYAANGWRELGRTDGRAGAP